MCVGASRDQRKVLGPLELELWEVGCEPPDKRAGNETLILRTSRKCSESPCLSSPYLNSFMTQNVCLGTCVHVETRGQPHVILKIPSLPMMRSFIGLAFTN